MASLTATYLANKQNPFHFTIKKGNKKKEKKKKPTKRSVSTTELLQFYNSIDFESKKKLLDSIITDSIDEYVLLNLAYKDELYITEEMEREMIHGVLERVWNRMSNAIKENIYFLYNANNDDELLVFISTQVALKVVDYKVKINSPNNEIQ